MTKGKGALMHPRHNPILLLAGASLTALVLAACGGNSSDNGNGGNSMASSSDFVSTRSVDGFGTVLVDSQDAALYTNDMDRGSKIVCTAGCAADWTPLVAPSGDRPTSDDSAVQAKLGTIKRPDGTSQVTFDDKPLYSFVEDPAGEVTGDGFTDSFAGTRFVWTVATSSGSGSSAAGESTGSGGSGYGGGGY
jgi:predicted lipoprotein with Yx(FWY)xxD motif